MHRRMYRRMCGHVCGRVYGRGMNTYVERHVYRPMYRRIGLHFNVHIDISTHVCGYLYRRAQSSDYSAFRYEACRGSAPLPVDVYGYVYDATCHVSTRNQLSGFKVISKGTDLMLLQCSWEIVAVRHLLCIIVLAPQLGLDPTGDLV